MENLLVEKRGKEYFIKLYGVDYRLIMPLEIAETVSKVVKPSKQSKKIAKQK